MRAILVSLLVACSTESPSTELPADAPVAPTRPPMTNGASTLAGWSDAGYLDGARDINLFHNPVNVAVGPDNRVYVADFDNNKLRVIELDGTSRTVIAMPRPFGLAFAGNTLYVQTDNDPDNGHSTMTGTIWSVDVEKKTARVVAKAIGRPRGLVALRDGMLGAADYVHHVVELIDPVTGEVTRLAGAWDVAGLADGADARFSEPYGIVEQVDGTLLVADRANNRLRQVGRDGVVSTFAGSELGYRDGSIADARFAHPQGLAIATNGDVFVSDTDNFRVRRLTSDHIETVAGDGSGAYGDDDDPMRAAFYGLEGLSVTRDGHSVFVADGSRGEDLPYNRVRMILRGP